MMKKGFQMSKLQSSKLLIEADQRVLLVLEQDQRYGIDITSFSMSFFSLVPGVHGRRKEHLVSAVCACIKLTIFIAPLFLNSDITILIVFD